MRSIRMPRRRLRAAVTVEDIVAFAAADGATLTPGQKLVAAALTADPCSTAVYVVGPPGTGKTAVVDWWVRACGAAGRPRVLRRHLHDFFTELHGSIGVHGGWEPGLRAVLSRSGRPFDVVCLDEFTVHDPADGVFLDRVLTRLSARGTRVVVTSNRRPAELMPNPLFHAGFEPTIAALEEMFTIVSLADAQDMRVAGARGSGFGSGVWREGARSNGEIMRDRVVRPGSQPFPVLEGVGGTVEIDFADMCSGPANAADFRWFAQEYAAMAVTGVRCDLGPASLARWAMLLDVLHDADVRMDVYAMCTRSAMSAALTAVLPDAARTVSRMGGWRDEGRLVP
ncbi:cell division protein ZapE [Gordonia sp. (in: high G+C Gram-positive bacteria)]|uniref:cell division protein ZapE n=1 Tax=Gordonia sp. (in: high G+C Gram-positive bacteria) TaxID=84139 RepID=UPI003F972370